MKYKWLTKPKPEKEQSSRPHNNRAISSKSEEKSTTAATPQTLRSKELADLGLGMMDGGAVGAGRSEGRNGAGA